MEGGTQLPSSTELQQHMQDPGITLPAASTSAAGAPRGSPPLADAPEGSSPLGPRMEGVDRCSSYKSPVELLSAPSSGKVRGTTGYFVRGEVPAWRCAWAHGWAVPRMLGPS